MHFMEKKMNRDDFLLLSEEDQAAFLQAQEEEAGRITDLEAERDSFKSENATLKAEREKLENELKSTKELNFTLARKFNNSADKKSAEEIMNELFK